MFLHSCQDIVFKVATTPELVRKARQLQHDVFLEMGYIKNPFPNRIIPLPSYVKRSTWIVATKKSLLLGTLRVSKVSSVNAVFEDWEIKNPKIQGLLKEVSSSSFAEVGGLAIKKEYRKQKISGGLYKACWLYALLKRIKWYLIKIDKKAFESFKKFGWHTIVVAPPKFYMGSISVPAIINIEKQLPNVYRENFEFYKYLIS